jgi:hypothetical protein
MSLSNLKLVLHKAYKKADPAICERRAGFFVKNDKNYCCFCASLFSRWIAS